MWHQWHSLGVVSLVHKVIKMGSSILVFFSTPTHFPENVLYDITKNLIPVPLSLFKQRSSYYFLPLSLRNVVAAG